MTYLITCKDCGTNAERTLFNGSCYWCGSFNLTKRVKEMNMLEAIKHKRDSLDQLVEAGVINISLLNDFNWLIGEAEKAERYEKALEFYAKYSGPMGEKARMVLPAGVVDKRVGFVSYKEIEEVVEYAYKNSQS